MEAPLYIALTLILIGIGFIASVYLQNFIRSTPKASKPHLK